MAKLVYTLKHDLLFKMLFVRHPDLLQTFVGLALGIPQQDITEFTIVNTEIPPELLTSKFCRLDINMKVNGKLVDLEVQVNDEGAFAERAAYYGCREFSMALPSSEEYGNAPAVIIISIVAFPIWRGGKVHSIFQILEAETHERMTDKLEWHFFELPKLGEIHSDDELELMLQLFHAETEEELEQLERLEVPVVQKMLYAYRSITAMDESQRTARALEDARHNEATALGNAERRGRLAERNANILALNKAGAPMSLLTAAFGMTEDEIRRVLEQDPAQGDLGLFDRKEGTSAL